MIGELQVELLRGDTGKLLLTIRGNLDLRGTAIEALPETLSIGGNINLSDSAITAKPAKQKKWNARDQRALDRMKRERAEDRGRER